MKKLALILSAGLAIQGCASSPQPTDQLRNPAHGEAVKIRVKPAEISNPTGHILPGMKGAWVGQLDRPGYQGAPLNAGLILSGKTQNNRQAGDMNLFRAVQFDCTSALVFVRSESDGTAIFAKVLLKSPEYCEQGFVRVQPLSDGNLRVSEHRPIGLETSAGIFTRAVQ